MVDNVSKIVNILNFTGRVQETKLLKMITNEKLMAPMTARKAIIEAVNQNKIVREERVKGKQKLVFFTVHKDIAQDEKDIFEEHQKLVRNFDSGFSFFKEKFPSLSPIEKAKCYDLFSLFLLHFHVSVKSLWMNFGKTNEWSTLLQQITSMQESLNELISSCSDLERGLIGNYIVERKFLYMTDINEQLRIQLKDIKLKYTKNSSS